MERVKGIEPSYSAWKAAALPLSYTRGFGARFFAIRGDEVNAGDRQAAALGEQEPTP
jgi:hypothetical protein